MKWRIQETDGNWVTLECLIKSLEISLLIRKDLSECFLSLFYCIRTDHLTESSDSVFLEEHMLCTAKSDTFGTELTSLLSICRSICICSYFELSVFISPCHNTSELAGDCSINCWDKTCIDVTCSTIDRDL